MIFFHEQAVSSYQKQEYGSYYNVRNTNIYQVTTGEFFGAHLEEPWVSIILKTTL